MPIVNQGDQGFQQGTGGGIGFHPDELLSDQGISTNRLGRTSTEVQLMQVNPSIIGSQPSSTSIVADPATISFALEDKATIIDPSMNRSFGDAWNNFNENLSNTADNLAGIFNSAKPLVQAVTNPTVTTQNQFDLGGTAKLLIFAVVGFIVWKMFGKKRN